MRKISLLLCMALVFSLILTACAPDSSNPNTTTSGTNQETEAGEATSNAGGASNTSLVTGGTLRIGTSLAPVQLGYTPEASGNLYIPFFRTSFNTLVFYDENGNLAEELAVKWEADPEAATIRFTLREGVKFHDGTEFNAEAVKWNIEKYQEAKRSEVASIESIDVIDDSNLVLNLSGWNSSSLVAVGTCVYMMSPTAFEANGGTPEGSYSNAVGTGPFKLVEWAQTVNAVYEANRDYWVEDQPYLDRVEYTFIAEPTTLVSAFQAGELDIINNLADLVLQQQLMGTPEYIFAANSNGVGVESVGFIPASADPDSPFADARVRQAMCYALDDESLLSTLGYGLLTPLNQWAVEGASTWSPNVKGYPYNPERARELLAEAGYPDGFDTKFHAPSASNDWAVAVAGMLTDVGIRTQVNTIDGTMNTNMMTSGWDGIMYHFASISPDLGLWMGRHLDVDGAFFAPGIQHPQDALDLLQAVRTAKTEEEKQQYSWQLQELIYDTYALFGQVMYVNAPATVKHEYVQDENFRVQHSLAWTPATAWLLR